MILKRIDYPEKVYYYNALENRMTMTKLQKDDFIRQQYGYEGESSFFEKLENTCAVVLWDISLDMKYSGQAQYDFLVLHGDTVVHYDIKNYKGSFKMEGNHLISNFGRRYDNPEDQRIRSEQILRKFVDASMYYKTVESYIVFINPEFHFDGSVGDKPWLFISHLPKHLKQYGEEDYRYDSNLKLGHHILQHHQPLSHLNVPIRTPFEEVAPGIKCPNCRQIVEVTYGGSRYFKCPSCGNVRKLNNVLLFNLNELAMLKGDTFSVSEAMVWCRNPARSTMHRVLQKYFIKHGHTKGATYEMKK